MKDYTLTEIQAICKDNKDEFGYCSSNCPFSEGYCGYLFGFYTSPCDWELDSFIEKDELKVIEQETY